LCQAIYGDCLIRPGPQMHLDALLRVVIARCVLELLRIEIRSENSVDSGMKIEIERSRQSERIIVSRKHLIQIFHEIRAQKKSISRFEVFPHGFQKLLGDRRIEIADRAAEE